MMTNLIGVARMLAVLTALAISAAALADETLPVVFLQGGKQFAAAGQDGTVWIWDAETGRQEGQLQVSARADLWVMAMAFSPDGRMIAAGGAPDKPTVRVWALPSGKPVGKFLGHKGWLKQVAFSPDSKALLSASEDTTAMIWDAGDSGGRSA